MADPANKYTLIINPIKIYGERSENAKLVFHSKYLLPFDYLIDIDRNYYTNLGRIHNLVFKFRKKYKLSLYL